MKVIFLDIDGVLINHDSLQAGNTADGECVNQLNRLTRDTGAVLVVSSTWRKRGLLPLVRQLRLWGVEANVLGITPVLDVVRQSGIAVAAERGHEIQAYLDAMPLIESFVILDDEDDMGELRPYLVQTDFETGLTAVEVEQAKRLLHQPQTVLPVSPQTA